MSREDVLEADGYRCQYCLAAPAIHVDHVIPKALRRRHHIADRNERYLVASCGPCNWRKGTRRFLPASRAYLMDELPGSGWRIWDGSPEPGVRKRNLTSNP